MTLETCTMSVYYLFKKIQAWKDEMTGNRSSNPGKRVDQDELRQRQKGGVGAQCWAGVC